MNFRLVNHLPVYDASQSIDTGETLYTVLFGANGVFVESTERPEIHVRLHIVDHPIPGGLAELEPFVKFNCPPVPAEILTIIWTLARTAAAIQPMESLFYLWLNERGEWHFSKPPQRATASSVEPTDQSPESDYFKAVIEVHSHHTMPAFWSSTDTAHENRFRVYAVLGNIFKDAQILVRVGAWGYFVDLPAASIFELPEGMSDAMTADPDWESDVHDIEVDYATLSQSEWEDVLGCIAPLIENASAWKEQGLRLPQDQRVGYIASAEETLTH